MLYGVRLQAAVKQLENNMTESAAGDWKTLSKYPFMACEVRVDVGFVALPRRDGG